MDYPICQQHTAGKDQTQSLPSSPDYHHVIILLTADAPSPPFPLILPPCQAALPRPGPACQEHGSSPNLPPPG